MQVTVNIQATDRSWTQAMRAGLPGTIAVAGTMPGTALVCVAPPVRPDVILMECGADARDNRERLARARCVAVAGVLVAFDRCTPELLADVLEAGGRGFALKATALPSLRQGLCAIHRGETWFSGAALLQALRPGPAPLPAAEPPQHDLTPRERQILHLIGLGMSNKEIGRQLAISEQTVKTHLHRVYVKLNRSGRYKAYLAQPGAALPPPPGVRGGVQAALG